MGSQLASASGQDLRLLLVTVDGCACKLGRLSWCVPAAVGHAVALFRAGHPLTVVRWAVDLLSQMIISLAENYAARESPNYPVGRARLEALGVVACACLMSVASLEVLQLSAGDIYNGIVHGTPQSSSHWPQPTHTCHPVYRGASQLPPPPNSHRARNLRLYQCCGHARNACMPAGAVTDEVHANVWAQSRFGF